MPLDPQIKEVLDELSAIDRPAPWKVPIEQARADFNVLTKAMAAPGAKVARIENRTIPGPHGDIPVRIYWPEPEGGPLPVVVHFHGSGFVVLGLDSHDHVCRMLCHDAGAIVVAVDYRKAPENKFPKPTDDAWAATTWVAENCELLGADPARIAVAGDSAGGCLATVVAQRAKAEGGPALVFQLLIYPVTDLRNDTDSYRAFAEGYMLTSDMMRWFRRCYLNTDADRTNPVAAPFHAKDLSGLPPAFVLTAGFDPLLDEGKAYAKKMEAAGVAVTYVNFEEQIHGFWTMDGRIDASKDAHTQACTALREAFGTE